MSRSSVSKEAYGEGYADGCGFERAIYDIKLEKLKAEIQSLRDQLKNVESFKNSHQFTNDEFRMMSEERNSYAVTLCRIRDDRDASADYIRMLAEAVLRQALEIRKASAETKEG